MKRISKELKAIADAHMEAKMTGKWNSTELTPGMTLQGFSEVLQKGHTFPTLMDLIETVHCSVGSLIVAGVIGHKSNAYRAGVYKGFKHMFGLYI
jgi:hypothetical protein